jgi:hypothetical protein
MSEQLRSYFGSICKEIYFEITKLSDDFFGRTSVIALHGQWKG